MRKLFVILTFFCISIAFANNKVACIKDPDGFANIRSGQGTDFPIVGTVDTTEFVYCETIPKSDWVKVMTLTWGKKKQVEGYMHKSKIQCIDGLDTKEQKQLLTVIIGKHKVLADKFRIACENKKPKQYREAVDELESDSELKYTPILSILPSYFCATNDSTMIKLFFATMWSDRGSANETPSFAIGECFICNPDLVIGEYEKLATKKEKKVMLDIIQWGLLNHFNVGEDGKSNNAEYIRLNLKLNKLNRQLKP